MPTRLHSHTCLPIACSEITLERLGFLAVLQSTLSALPGFGIYKRNLLEVRVVVTSYNQPNQPARLLSPKLFGWLSPTKVYARLGADIAMEII